VRKESRFMTDEGQHYRSIGRGFTEHGTVVHSADEYVRGDIHTNTVEGYYSIFKRGMKGLPALLRKASAPLSGGI
jgi:hypothetical protein